MPAKAGQELLKDHGSEGSSGEELSSSSSVERSRMRRESTSRTWRLEVAVLFTVVGGVLVLCLCEGIQIVEAAWVITQVVTTIGYGDITFTSKGTRLFMSFYILWLLVLVAYMLNSYVQYIWEQQSEDMRRRIRELERLAVLKHEEHHNHQLGLDAPVHDVTDRDIKARFGGMNKLLWAFLSFFAHVLFGTILYAWLEPCTCSYGQTVVEGCTEENMCETGYTKDLASSFYMSIVTLTTVGFGDVTPRTWIGRIIGIPWMLSGILSTAWFLEALQNRFIASETATDLDDEQICEEVFDKFDKEGTGALSKEEFVNYVLVSHGFVGKGVLDDIARIYEAIDQNHDQVITYAEVREFQTQLQEEDAAAC